MELTINCPDCGKTLKVTVVAEDAPRTEIIRKVATPTTWQEIAEKIKSGKAREFLSVGDIVPFEMKDGQKVNAVVAEIDPYGENEVAFVIEDCISNRHSINKSGSNTGGWRDCEMRKYLNTTIYDLLPDDLKEVIAERTIKQTENDEDLISKDKLWLLSCNEVGLEYDTTDKDDVHFSLFKDERSRIKQQDGETTWYWLRSPNPDYSISFWCVYTSGDGYYINVGNSYGVAWGFLVK